MSDHPTEEQSKELKCRAIKRDNNLCSQKAVEGFDGFCKHHIEWVKKGGKVLGAEAATATVDDTTVPTSPKETPKAEPALTLKITTSSGKLMPIQEVLVAMKAYGTVTVKKAHQSESRGVYEVHVEDK